MKKILDQIDIKSRISKGEFKIYGKGLLMQKIKGLMCLI